MALNILNTFLDNIRQLHYAFVNQNISFNLKKMVLALFLFFSFF